MISAVSFIKRSYAKDTPDHYELSPEEVEQLKHQTSIHQQQQKNHKKSQEKDADQDEEEEEEEEEEEDDDDIDMENEQFETNFKELTDLGKLDKEDDDIGSDVEDFHLKPNDRILLVATTEDDFSVLEMHIYDPESASLYVHHDIALPAFPLCMAWMGVESSILRKSLVQNDHNDNNSNCKNFVAIGSFNPVIEIWNLDVIDVLEPVLELGSDTLEPLGKNKKKSTASASSKGGHTDAVMSLSWNQLYPSLLLSGSADKTLRLWDVESAKDVQVLKHHKDKVSTCYWNPAEGSVALSGSFDKSVVVFDIRQSSSSSSAKFSLKSNGDVERAIWDPTNPALFLVSCEDGSVSCFDARKGNSTASSTSSNPGLLFQFHPHKKPTTGLAFSSAFPGLLATCSEDKSVKLFNTRDATNNTVTPSLLGSKVMEECGKLFDISFCPDEPLLLSVGGDAGVVALWDIQEVEAISRLVPKKNGVESLLSSISNEKSDIVTPDFSKLSLKEEIMEEEEEEEEAKVEKEKKHSKKKKEKKSSSKKKD